MTDFGDYEEDDAFDTAPADPEQVARKLYALQNGVWDQLTDDAKVQRIEIIVLLLAWLRRSGALR